MTETVWMVGDTDEERRRWQPVLPPGVGWLGPDQIERASGAALVLEVSLGPLGPKRDRLLSLRDVGVSRIVSAATTATIAAQRQWLGDTVPMTGCDPLLMLAGGRVQTVSAGDHEALALLDRIWPEWEFTSVADSIGMVFSREILPIINEAVAFFEHGVSTEDINQGTKLGLNYPRGPLEWAEMFGWSSVYWGLRALEDMYGPRFRPHPWIRRKVGSSLLEREAL